VSKLPLDGLRGVIVVDLGNHPHLAGVRVGRKQEARAQLDIIPMEEVTDFEELRWDIR
jgi:hypothetical protein